MKYISFSDKILRKFSDKSFVWYPYAGFNIIGRSSILFLAECVISGLLKDENLRITLSRIIPAKVVFEATDLPLLVGIVEHHECAQDLSEIFHRSENSLQGKTIPSIFDTTDYLAARILGVPSAVRRLEATLGAYAIEALSPLKLLEELNLRDLEYQGVVFQLMAIDRNKDKIYIIEGERHQRLRLLEKILKENYSIRQFLYNIAKPLT